MIELECKHSLVTTTLSVDCEDVNSGRRGDNVDRSTDDDDDVAGSAVSFTHLRSLKYRKIHLLCARLNGTTSNAL